MDDVLIVVVMVFLAFVGFAVYFIFKMLQFVIQAINLYKDIVTRQDAIIKLLIDVRDGTKVMETAALPQVQRVAVEESPSENVKEMPSANPALVEKFGERPSEKLREMLAAPAGTYNPDVLAAANKVLDTRGESVQ